MFILGIFTAIIIIFSIGLLLVAIYKSTMLGNITIPIYAFFGGTFITIGIGLLIYNLLITN